MELQFDDPDTSTITLGGKKRKASARGGLPPQPRVRPAPCSQPGHEGGGGSSKRSSSRGSAGSTGHAGASNYDTGDTEYEADSNVTVGRPRLEWGCYAQDLLDHMAPLHLEDESSGVKSYLVPECAIDGEMYGGINVSICSSMHTVSSIMDDKTS